MKKATLVFPIILLVASLSAFGLNLSSYGYKVTNTQQENNQTVYTVSGPTGLTFTVASANPLTDSNAKVIETVVSTLTGWKNLTISQAKIVFNGPRADILIIPSSFVYKNVNLAQYMPSGMQFYYDKYLQYDFRMFKDNLFLRLKGEVYDESQFVDRLYSAEQNPVLFLRTNNPEYLLQSLSALQKELAKLTRQLGEQNKAIAKAESQITQQGRSQAALNVDVQTQLAGIKKNGSTIADEFDKVRYSLLAFNNRSFFGQIQLINRAAIDQVVAMKKADPSLTKAQVLAKLKSKGVTISDQEVSLVFDVYFNEFK